MKAKTLILIGTALSIAALIVSGFVYLKVLRADSDNLLGADQYVYELPEYSAVVNDSTHIIYIDAGGIDKHLEMPTLLSVMGDTADQVRTEVDTAKANIRAAIGGGGILIRTGSLIQFVNNTDSMIFGEASTDVNYRYIFKGTTKLHDKVTIADTIRLTDKFDITSGTMYMSGDNLMLDDDNNTPVSLSALKTGGSIFSSVASTKYATDVSLNWHFGGTTATTYKVKITGDGYVDGSVHIEDNLRLYTSNKAYYMNLAEYANEGWLKLTWSFDPSYDLLLTPYNGAGMYSEIYNAEVRMTTQHTRISNGTSSWLFYPDSICLFERGSANQLNRVAFIDDVLGVSLEDGGTANDTIFLGYEATSNKTRWIGLSHTKGLYSDSTANASYGLHSNLPSIYDFMSDTLNGELNWSTYDPDGTEHKSRGIDTLSPGKQIQSLMDGIEKNYRYNLEQQKEIDRLKRGQGLLFLFIICLGFVIIFKK